MREKSFLGNRGMAIVAVMVFTFILLILGATFLRLATTERISADKSIHLTRAFYLAEAGLERGRSWLSLASPPPTSVVDPFDGSQSFSGGTYQVTITPLSATQYEISSIGRFGSPTVSKTLKSIVQIKSIFSHAVFGDENVTLESNAYTDSYDSQDGLYGGANVKSDGDIGTNAIVTMDPYSVYLKNNARVNGNVTIGPDGDPYDAIRVAGTALITGTQSAASSPKELVEVIPPSGLTEEDPITLGGNSTLTINTSGEYPSIQLDSNSILTLEGEDLTIYITGALSLNSNGQIRIAEGSDVTICLAGSFSQSSNSQINNLTKNPTKLSIYGTDALASVNWASNSDFYGGFYARNANMNISSNAKIYGSIIAKTVSLASNARIHYDETLAEESDYGSGYRVISWEEEPAVWE